MRARNGEPLMKLSPDDPGSTSSAAFTGEVMKMSRILSPTERTRTSSHPSDHARVDEFVPDSFPLPDLFAHVVRRKTFRLLNSRRRVVIAFAHGASRYYYVSFSVGVRVFSRGKWRKSGRFHLQKRPRRKVWWVSFPSPAPLPSTPVPK